MNQTTNCLVEENIPTKKTKSEARKQYWATIPKEERSSRAREIAKIKHQQLTREQRQNHALLMVKAKLEKKTLIKI